MSAARLSAPAVLALLLAAAAPAEAAAGRGPIDIAEVRWLSRVCSKQPGASQMGQRARILTQIAGFTGWKVTDAYWENPTGKRFEQVGCYDVPIDAKLVLVMGRRWAPRCGQCLAIVSGPPH